MPLNAQMIRILRWISADQDLYSDCGNPGEFQVRTADLKKLLDLGMVSVHTCPHTTQLQPWLGIGTTGSTPRGYKLTMKGNAALLLTPT